VFSGVQNPSKHGFLELRWSRGVIETNVRASGDGTAACRPGAWKEIGVGNNLGESGSGEEKSDDERQAKHLEGASAAPRLRNRKSEAESEKEIGGTTTMATARHKGNQEGYHFPRHPTHVENPLCEAAGT